MHKKIVLFIMATVLLSSCVAARSDSLGLVKDDQLKSYNEKFEPARAMLREGRFDELKQTLLGSATDVNGNPLDKDALQDKLIAENSELSLLERGVLALNCGEYERALLYFDAAEAKLDAAEEASKLSGTSNDVAKSFATLMTGREELGDYDLRGHEKVMLYNFKSICYMLMGDRRAYNVTRKAIARQQEEWEKFTLLMEKTNEKLEAERSEAKAQSGNGNILKEIEKDDRDAYIRNKAGTVASAYVNPFGDYINAVIMEIDSISASDLRDNARIAYTKVLSNNKSCLTARDAAKDLQSRRSIKGQKLVHVVLADGFSPSKSVKSYMFQVDSLKAQVNYTQLEANPSQVGGARITVAGKKLSLSPMSDMEAIILRDEQDRMPLRTLMFTSALFRSAAANHFGGSLLGKMTASLQQPDTRLWLSLPNKVLVARIYVPAKTKELTLDILNERGSSMGSTRVRLADAGPSFIYGVSYDKTVRAYVNKASWVRM